MSSRSEGLNLYLSDGNALMATACIVICEKRPQPSPFDRQRWMLRNAGLLPPSYLEAQGGVAELRQQPQHLIGEQRANELLELSGPHRGEHRHASRLESFRYGD